MIVKDYLFLIGGVDSIFIMFFSTITEPALNPYKRQLYVGTGAQQNSIGDWPKHQQSGETGNSCFCD